jgi:hypothetical protein
MDPPRGHPTRPRISPPFLLANFKRLTEMWGCGLLPFMIDMYRYRNVIRWFGSGLHRLVIN